MLTKIIAAAVLSIGFAGSGFFIAHGLVDSRQVERYVEVKGLAEKIVKSDEAVWTLSTKLVSNDLPSLYQAIDDAQAKTRKFLKEQGFNDNELSANPVSVTDNQSINYSSNQQIPRYSADTGMTVSTTKVDTIMSAVQKTGDLVQQGIVVTNSNALFRFSDLNRIKPEMLNEATLNAQAAAESFAKNAHATLGKIRQARQGLFTIMDANSSYDSGNAIMKKVRIVTTIEFELH